MVYRKDLSRIAESAAEKSGFDFDIVYNFLWKVIKENNLTVKAIKGKIKATKGEIFISSANRLYMENQHHDNRWHTDEADYWEGRILARQEACYD